MLQTETTSDTSADGAKKRVERRRDRRILIVVSFANVAGAQIAALRLAQGLRTRGHDPRVVFLYQQTAIDNPYHPYEVVLPRARPGFGGYVEIAKSMISLVRDHKPDVVLTFLPLAHAIGQAAALRSGVPRRIAAHRMPIDTAQKPLRVVDFLYAWMGVYTEFTAVSRSVLETCRPYPSRLFKSAKVIYNGLLDFEPSQLDRISARRKFGLPEEGLVLVAVGRFVHQKNYPLLLRVMRELKDGVVAIAGDGPLRAQIEREIEQLRVQDRVVLLGNVERPDVPDLIAAGDMFVQPSTYEGNSNSMLEALRAGAVVLAHDVPEQREVVVDDVTGQMVGVLVPLDNVDAWAAAIRSLAADPEERARLSNLATARASRFSYDRMIGDYDAIVSN